MIGLAAGQHKWVMPQMGLSEAARKALAQPVLHVSAMQPASSLCRMCYHFVQTARLMTAFTCRSTLPALAPVHDTFPVSSASAWPCQSLS